MRGTVLFISHTTHLTRMVIVLECESNNLMESMLLDSLDIGTVLNHQKQVCVTNCFNMFQLFVIVSFIQLTKQHRT